MKFNLVDTFNTTYCADSVEWCPFTPYQHYFVCGTYELQSEGEAKQVRLGQLHLFWVSKELKLHLLDSVDSSGILDIKWCPKIIKYRTLFATANADGKILVWNFCESPNQLGSIKLASMHELNNPAVLSLSLDWSTTGTAIRLCVSDSLGFLFVLQLNDQLELVLVNKLNVHNYEAWVVTFDSANNSLLLSGADDCLLKITDLQTGKKVTQIDEHKSGVTAIRFSPNENIFASGSYDETVKIWDSRYLSHSLSSLEIGGGIWRIKWDQEKTEHVLVAGMYAGIFWLHFTEANATLKLLSAFKEHESITYGADICYFTTDEIKNYFKETKATKLITTCSFYDKKLCLSFL